MNKLWYKSPAKKWNTALPVGNGITGVMLFGGKKSERLCFNDTTFWSGYPKDYNSAESAENLEQVRKLIFNDEPKAAQNIIENKLCGFYSESYLPIGEIRLRLHKTSRKGYSRSLRLDDAIFSVDTARTKRECFVSYPDKIAVYRISSKTPFSITISAKSNLKYNIINDGALNLTGNAPDYVAPNYLLKERNPIKYNEGRGMAFALRAEAETDGEKISKGKKLVIKNATEIIIRFATATGFKSYNEMPDTDREKAVDKCKGLLQAATKNYDELKNRHIEDFKRLYNRETFSLCENADLPTDKLLSAAKKGNYTAALTELLYNFGKYLIISGSRIGGQAMNLQGIWNNDKRPPWSSNYTTNINAQMNYWAAGTSNLHECVEPYINMVYETMQNGKKTAKINYNCNGFACNHNVDLWRKTPPVKGSAGYMYAPLCGVWLSNEIFELYKNGGLSQYKEKIFEICEQAAIFANEYLTEYNGEFVICPSTSPENNYYYNGDKLNVDYATAFDMSLVKQCFQNYISEFENELSKEIKQKIPKLFDFKSGKNGLLEWHSDFDAPEKGHRHFSPLYGFYPARVIKYYKDNHLVSAVNGLFNYRLDNVSQSVGWSQAWAICIAARLHDGDKAEVLINKMFEKSFFINLFDVCLPRVFQIDGNFGFVAGINEMLVYYEDGIYDILPALPVSWQTGSVNGIFVYGVSLSFSWKNGQATEIIADKPIAIRKTAVITQATKLSENISIYGGME